MLTFLACALLTIWKTGFFLLAFAAWLVCFIADQVASKRFRRESQAFREANSERYPDVFSAAPPTDLDSIEGKFVDLFDVETGLFMGRSLKQDIQTLYDAFEYEALIFENGPNDIPLTQDFIDHINEMEDHHLTPHFLSLMDHAMDDQQLTLLTIRWVAPQALADSMKPTTK